nr:immunoglobulin light chain junction region [Macaca mulatta]MPO00798.1 immunoglobulin light chain junction region [Macaca mulatta]
CRRHGNWPQLTF